ncbi:Dbl-domain containing protein [Metarhizium album ARSEF 1941]|uniref:Dbl-domain containing protein n=1 Tax=Metarhizium album (strain ARSEF 1941) TaxID=1081103 RepID=A0A0B2WKX8_METAS|nr:Dbl-domain containing protein [Metarhizium album ARSEF 1941]KHN94142.1 Dbl-domain containing protein [Metarhizium album ARSEF 1941]
MAIAVSTFCTPRASVDDFGSTNSTSPIVGKNISSFKFPHFSTYAGQFYEGLSHRRRQIKSLLDADGTENNAQVWQEFSHWRIDQMPSAPTCRISDTPEFEPGKYVRPQSPFRKWVVSIQKRNKHSLPSRKLPNRGLPYWLWVTGEDCGTSPPYHSIRTKSSSGSSFNFVSAVRSASASLAGLSTVTRSGANTAFSRCASRVEHGAGAFTAEPRQSEEVSIERPIRLDADALDRAVKRRRILDELVHTEQDYITDIRLLLNLHEEFLDELQRAVSHSDFKEFCHPEGATGIASLQFHDRTQAFGCGGGANVHGGGSTMETSELCTEPQVIVEVSKIFERQVKSIAIHETSAVF